MSIASELNALNGYILGAYDEINTKGGTVPANKNMANLASAIASISGGGGGGGDIDLSALGITKAESGTFTNNYPNTANYWEVPHTLGVVPKLALYIMADDTYLENSSTSSNKCAVFGLKIQTGEVSGYYTTGGIYIDVCVGGYKNGGNHYQATNVSYADTHFASANAVDIRATRFTYSYNFTAYKATTSSITFYRGVNNAYFSPYTTYNYLIAG